MIIPCTPPNVSIIECICQTKQDLQREDFATISYETIVKGLMNTPQVMLKNRISEISQLKTNWDGGGACVPSDRVIKNCFKFLDKVELYNFSQYIKAEDIVPTPYGTVDFDFETNEGMVSVEIGTNGIGYFTEFFNKEDVLCENLNTDFREIPQELLFALYKLEE